MKYAVKVDKGIAIGSPFILSGSQMDSPNSSWSLEQLKLNGYLPVDLDYNPDIEIIDLTSPTVLSDNVTYLRIDLSKSDKDAITNKKIDYLRQAEYPTQAELVTALWESIVNKNDMQMNLAKQKFIDTDNKYPKV